MEDVGSLIWSRIIICDETGASSGFRDVFIPHQNTTCAGFCVPTIRYQRRYLFF